MNPFRRDASVEDRLTALEGAFQELEDRARQEAKRRRITAWLMGIRKSAAYCLFFSVLAVLGYIISDLIWCSSSNSQTTDWRKFGTLHPWLVVVWVCIDVLVLVGMWLADQ